MIRKVADGEDPLRDEVIGRPDLIDRLMEGFRESFRLIEEAPINPLTPRERDVLRHVAAGMRNRQIGEVLDIGEQTVKNHLSSVMHKLGVSNRLRAVTAAVRAGWLTLDEEATDAESRRRQGRTIDHGRPRSTPRPRIVDSTGKRRMEDTRRHDSEIPARRSSERGEGDDAPARRERR